LRFYNLLGNIIHIHSSVVQKNTFLCTNFNLLCNWERAVLKSGWGVRLRKRKSDCFLVGRLYSFVADRSDLRWKNSMPASVFNRHVLQNWNGMHWSYIRFFCSYFLISNQQDVTCFHFKHKETFERLSRGFREGSVRFSPRSPKVTLRQPYGNPLWRVNTLRQKKEAVLSFLLPVFWRRNCKRNQDDSHFYICRFLKNNNS